jgi:hypothetical protein
VTPPALTAEPPRLSSVEDEPRERMLDEIVRGVLAEPLRSPCVVCGGGLDVVAGGVCCVDCASELLVGVEPAVAWTA